MVQAATLAPAAAPSPSRQKGQPAKRGALQRVAPPALEAPEEAAEAPAAAPAVEAPAGAAAADGLPPDDASDGESAESDALGETLSLPRAPTPVVDAGDPEDEDGGDYFYGDDDDDDASDADAPGSDAVLARELAEQFALEDLQEQRRELLGSFAMTLVARANSASRAVHSPRQLVRHRELLAQVSESMDLLHSLMPALEATGLVPAASMNVRPETHKGLLPQQVAELPRCRGADRPTVSKCAKHDDDEACAICLCEIAEDEEVIALPCRHSYHARCVGDWLQRSPTCPSCSLDVAKALDIELAPTAAEQRERANRHRSSTSRRKRNSRTSRRSLGESSTIPRTTRRRSCEKKRSSCAPRRRSSRCARRRRTTSTRCSTGPRTRCSRPSASSRPRSSPRRSSTDAPLSPACKIPTSNSGRRRTWVQLAAAL